MADHRDEKGRMAPARSATAKRMRAIMKTPGRQPTNPMKPLAEEKSLKGRARRIRVKRERQNRQKRGLS
jgi:hypothetical protein